MQLISSDQYFGPTARQVCFDPWTRSKRGRVSNGLFLLTFFLGHRLISCIIRSFAVTFFIFDFVLINAIYCH